MENNSRPLSDFLKQRQTTVDSIIEQVSNGLQTTQQSFTDSTLKGTKSVSDSLSQCANEVESQKSQSLNALKKVEIYADQKMVKEKETIRQSLNSLSNRITQIDKELEKTQTKNQSHTQSHLNQWEELNQAQITQSQYLDKCLLTALIASISGLLIGLTIGILLPF